MTEQAVFKGALPGMSQPAAVAKSAVLLSGALERESFDPSGNRMLPLFAARYDDQTQPPEKEPVTLQSRKEALMREFGIVPVGVGKVRLVLNGVARIEFLRQVHAVASDLHGRGAVDPWALDWWSRHSAFTDPSPKGLDISINGNVPGSWEYPRRIQKALGWNNVELCNLAVAHAAYFLATGEDLFCSDSTRACNGTLWFSPSGLTHNFMDHDEYSETAASAALPYPELPGVTSRGPCYFSHSA